MTGAPDFLRSPLTPRGMVIPNRPSTHFTKPSHSKPSSGVSPVEYETTPTYRRASCTTASPEYGCAGASTRRARMSASETFPVPALEVERPSARSARRWASPDQSRARVVHRVRRRRERGEGAHREAEGERTDPSHDRERSAAGSSSTDGVTVLRFSGHGLCSFLTRAPDESGPACSG